MFNTQRPPPVVTPHAMFSSLPAQVERAALPLALALPPPWDVAAMVIVFQSLVELFGMAAFLWLVPRTTGEAS